MPWTACNESWHQGPWIYEHESKAYIFSLIVTSFNGTEYFVLVIFDGINLSTASTKPVLNLTHMSITDMWLWSSERYESLKLGHVVFKSHHIWTFLEIDLSWCLFYPSSLNVILYVHNVVISFAYWGHPLDSIHRRCEIHKEQVKSFIIARWYIYDLSKIVLPYNIQKLLLRLPFCTSWGTCMWLHYISQQLKPAPTRTCAFPFDIIGDKDELNSSR